MITFIGFALAVTLPLLIKPGFVFLLDMVWSPRLELNDYLQNGIAAWLPIWLTIKALSYVLPLDLIQKLLLTLVLFVPGFSMYRLMRDRVERGWAIVAGLIYMLNPWVYERFLAGHWLVLLGYGFLPLALGETLRFWREPRASLLRFTAVWTIFPIISLHWTYIGAAMAFMMWLIDLAQAQSIRRRILRTYLLRYFIIATSVALVINSFWLIGFIAGQGTFHKIQLSDFAAFRTVSDPTLGPYVNVLGLYGFWNQAYLLPKDLNNVWWLVPLILLSLLAVGAYMSLSARDSLGFASIVGFALALAIAVGYAAPISQALVDFLFTWLPGFRGLRETEKVAGVLAFGYAYLAVMGAAWLARSRAQIRVVQVGLALVAVASVATMFWGFRGQLTARDYPTSWYEADALLRDAPHSLALFLPWHGYIAFEFTNWRRIANPAQTFFSVPVIQGKGTDNAYLREGDQGDWDRFVFELVHGNATLDDFAQFLQSTNVTHIALAKTADWERWQTILDESKLTKKVLAREDIMLYELNAD